VDKAKYDSKEFIARAQPEDKSQLALVRAITMLKNLSVRHFTMLSANLEIEMQ